MARGRRKRKRGGPPELERKPTETVSSLSNGAGEEAAAELADGLERRIEALRERGETAIKSFLAFLAGAPVLFLFASLLRLLQGPLSKHFGELADPMDKVLPLLDVKPVFALQALTLLLRTADILRNDRGRQ